MKSNWTEPELERGGRPPTKTDEASAQAVAFAITAVGAGIHLACAPVSALHVAAHRARPAQG
jgi:hypothetical protein